MVTFTAWCDYRSTVNWLRYHLTIVLPRLISVQLNDLRATAQYSLATRQT